MRNNIRKISHPGKYVSDAIEALNMTQNEFAIRTGLSAKNLNTLTNGKSNITYEVAEKLAAFFGNSINFWTNLQNRYESYLSLEKREKELEEEWEIVKLFDKDFLLKNCNINVDSKNKEKTIEELKDCFMVSSLNNLKSNDIFAFCRSSRNIKTSERETILRNAWISLVMKKANNLTCEKFDKKRVISIVEELRKLTLLEPDEFTPKLENILASVGIRYVELPYLKNSNISGVTKWIKNENAVVVGVNDYGKFADKIWFSIFHEIGHAIKNNKKHMTASLNSNNELDEDEIFANNFAQDSLIYADDYKEFISKKDFSLKAILAFAKKEGIHKDIVIGRLENDKFINHNIYKKEKFSV